MNIAKRFSRQLLDEPKAVIGGRSPGDLSSSGEGNTYTQPRNGQDVRRMMVTRTLTCPLAVGGA